MKKFPSMASIHLLILFAINLVWLAANKTVSTIENPIDHLSLLKFKESISSDPFEILASWNSSTHFCNWHGITCSPRHERVTELNLEGYQLHGIISPHVGNLSLLRNINLIDNNLYGKIPQELGRLFQLQQLSLMNNALTWEIPANLTRCSNLKHLNLLGNNLIDKIPIESGSFQNLQELYVGKNNLTGGIPPLIGNLSSLQDLSVGYNNLEGEIPQEICFLKNFKRMGLGANGLTGTFPSCIYNMSSLLIISVTQNQCTGTLPSNLFHTLPNIQLFEVGMNHFSGPIPTSVVNASTLQYLDLDRNHFIGQVPSLGSLKDLERLRLNENNFGSNSTKDLEFLKSLTNCSKLQVLSIAANNFGGHLPSSLGNLSTRLSELYLGYNHISGKIPSELGNLIGLTLLHMRNCSFEGTIPTTFQNFKNMRMLKLNANKLMGDIPTFIGNLSQLYYLDLAENMLEGNISPSIGSCQKLQYLNLSKNNLNGTIPLEVFSLSSLTILLDLSRNSFSGSLPDEVGRLKDIGKIDVSENHLSGDIPTSIGECTSLEYLYLQGNSFHGIIPSSLASLKGLQYLDLSRNQLSGSIPEDLQNISVLEFFNISFNMLEGAVPIKGVFQNASKLAVNGNSKLCGGILQLHLPPCPFKDKKLAKHHNFRFIIIIVSVVAFLIMLSFIVTMYWKRKRNSNPSFDSPIIDQLDKVSYQDLHHATDGFSSRNLIGFGSFGSVYKGNLLSEDKVVAIKVLNLQKRGANKSFLAECNVLKNIRHRNLVKILTCCSSMDYEGQEFKALVFEYMKNGSLEQWLHQEEAASVEHPRTLDLDQRLNIIIDVASALHYIHHECDQPIIHCDLKPSNVLLDDNMIAHVGDFGIARLLSTINGTSHEQTSTIEIKGTFGYAPPEYGTGFKVSTYGDMYSFGILVLEMLTGRRPTDEMFEDGQNLHKFVEISFDDNLFQILDPLLASRVEEATSAEEKSLNGLTSIVENCLISLFSIGLACSVESPKERMNIMDVIRELSIVKKAFLTGKIDEHRLNSMHITRERKLTLFFFKCFFCGDTYEESKPKSNV
ncbi:hypothetical protein VNO77_42630 [Canavalia gladiata]|uniref:non-specific serine/threonine protein kinase n=1 Tax=Canavalia gladiata TaxID=3824 RepID=A0AAN9PP98_CANGL